MLKIGSTVLWLSLIVILYSITAYLLGLKLKNKRLIKSAHNGVFANAILVTIASVILFYVLGVSDFSIEYVARYTSRNLPLVYKLAAFWAGNSGSLLLWFWLLSIYGVVVAFSKDPLKAKLKPYASLVILLIGLFFSILLNFDSSPFTQPDFLIRDGAGLNPMLQNIGMIVHPITQFLGYVGVAVPFAYLIADLILDLKGEAWVKVVRRWTLFTWLFLTIGMVSGGEWAYVELGWGGYWAWDPIENASLFPWLTITAFLHSLIIQEKKGVFKVWNASLVIVSFILTIFGTFLARSGILASVHAFSEGDTGTYFLFFMSLTTIISLSLFVWRFKSLKSKEYEFPFVSKENTFLINNWLICIIAAVVFFGTTYPLISQFIQGRQVELGQEFFNQATIPLWISMVLLMGLGTYLPWGNLSIDILKKRFAVPLVLAHLFGFGIYFLMRVRNFSAMLAITASFFVVVVTIIDIYRGIKARMKGQKEGFITAFIRLTAADRRKYGGYMVHIAIIMMVFGIAGSSAYQEDIQVTVNQDEVIKFMDYELTYNGLKLAETDHKVTVFAEIDVTKNGAEYDLLRPAQEYFGDPTEEDSSAQIDFRRNIREDLYLVLAGWDKGGEEATFWIVSNPVVGWVFWGMRLLVIGTIIALWPNEKKYYKELIKESV
ncbi:heme lyase CcmF/NrfE family subunit [Natroniella sp. ANB-PHB2]|uniref:heme lyase CcmF/NrfE family subunit n=1 Tax=Natroniella sp. ANB-PHB2 TaxID=3384444 RepID=UPI0038D4403E